VDLADHVLLDDLAHRPAVPVLHHHPGLEELGRPGEGQHRPAGGVDDLELVGEELVDVGHQPEQLLGRALADLADGPDLGAVLVVDGVLVVELDELGLLVDDQHRLGEEGARAGRRAGWHPGLGHVALDLLRGPLHGGDLRVTDRGIGRLPAVGGHVLGPLGTVEVPVLVTPEGVGVPVGGAGAHVGHAADRTAVSRPPGR
jgi:hypothetical protein